MIWDENINKYRGISDTRHGSALAAAVTVLRPKTEPSTVRGKDTKRMIEISFNDVTKKLECLVCCIALNCVALCYLMLCCMHCVILIKFSYLSCTNMVP